ncbi:hypothetical protein [Roseovarius sp. ZX-A-9]|uniref:hypothetical protein n=1 Tax=Roseovarius sp. ZX-A-9 TaxID=3014783 RepID=UPI002330E940|nr:hypothetical protein [Roseovarius sp. ZX-A-9]
MIRGCLILVVAVALVLFFPGGAPLPGAFGPFIGSAAQAGGGGADIGYKPSKKGSKKATKKKRPAKPVLKKNPKKKAAAKKPEGPFVPDTSALRAKRNGPAQRAQDKLEDYAREDNLKGLATSGKRMRAFKSNVDGLVDRARTSQEKVDANNVLVQLQRYKGARKQNPALAYYAHGILRGLAAMTAYERYLDADGKAAVAERFGDFNQKTDARLALEDARKAYAEARQRVPKALRPLHPKP